jgi:hypothetical protein
VPFGKVDSSSSNDNKPKGFCIKDKRFRLYKFKFQKQKKFERSQEIPA